MKTGVRKYSLPEYLEASPQPSWRWGATTTAALNTRSLPFPVLYLYVPFLILYRITLYCTTPVCTFYSAPPNMYLVLQYTLSCTHRICTLFCNISCLIPIECVPCNALTAKSVSRDQILRRERGQKKMFFLSVDPEQDWQPYLVDPYPALSDHIY